MRVLRESFKAVSILLVATLGFPLIARDAPATETEEAEVAVVPIASVALEADGEPDLGEVVKALAAKLEMEDPQSRWFDRYNLAHRVRVAVRTANASKGKTANVPVPAVIANTAGAVVGAHLVETFVAGPLLIKAGTALGGLAGAALTGYGGLLAWPVPTGTFVDVATESLCIVAGFVVNRKRVQRGLYKLELAAVLAAAKAAKRFGADKIYHALFDHPTGWEKIREVLDTDQTARSVRDATGRPLAELYFEKTDNGDARLIRFSLSPESETIDGRKALSSSLAKYGSNVRDAVLKPQMLLRAEHGVAVGTGPAREYQVFANAVRVKVSRFVPKPYVKAALRKLASFFLPSGPAAPGISCGEAISLLGPQRR